MNRFMRVLFGGLAATAAGVMAVMGVRAAAWQSPSLVRSAAGASMRMAAAALGIHQADGTSLDGFARVMRYTGAQEEDPAGLAVRNAAALAAAGKTSITAAAYVVKDLDTGRTAAGLDQDRRMPMASLAKLVTAAVARRLIPAGEIITLSASDESAYGNTAGFKAGESFKAGDLYYPLLMVSSNDAAEALAGAFGRPAFIAAMNSFAASIGAYRTSFADPSGLSPLDQTTPDDMAIVLDWLRKNDPGILAVTAMKSVTINGHIWINPTHFLSWSYYLGGKNGYTDQARMTGASLFKPGSAGDTYAIVVLGSSDRDGDEARLLDRVR